MKCLMFVGALFLCTIFAKADEEQFEEFVCQKEVRYVENECNGCWCNETGGPMACTLMACQSHLNTKLNKCKDGTTWKRDCNQCWCKDKLGTICTVRTC